MAKKTLQNAGRAAPKARQARKGAEAARKPAKAPKATQAVLEQMRRDLQTDPKVRIGPAVLRDYEKERAAPRAPTGKRAEIAAAAASGKLPSPPDFSANTHKPYRKRLEALVALVEAGDLKGLEAVEMLPPRSTSPKALHRYRDLAMIALKAKALGAPGK